MEASISLPVVVGLEGARLVETHVLCLLVGQFREMGVERGQMEARHVFICKQSEPIERPSAMNDRDRSIYPSSSAGDRRRPCSGPAGH